MEERKRERKEVVIIEEQKTEYENAAGIVGSEMRKRDRTKLRQP